MESVRRRLQGQLYSKKLCALFKCCTLNFFFFVAHASESFPKNEMTFSMWHIASPLSKLLKLSSFRECESGKGFPPFPVLSLQRCGALGSEPWMDVSTLTPRLLLLIRSFLSHKHDQDFSSKIKLGLQLSVLRWQCSYLPNVLTSA